MYLGQLEGGDPRIVCACCGLQNIPFGIVTDDSTDDSTVYIEVEVPEALFVVRKRCCFETAANQQVICQGDVVLTAVSKKQFVKFLKSQGF